MLVQKKKLVTLLFVVVLVLISTLNPKCYVLGKEKKNTIIYNQNGYEVEFKVNSQWEEGFEGQFIITNQSKKPLKNWRIRLKFDHEISSIWDGEIELQKGKEYIIKHPSWNQNISVGKKAIVGFIGKCNGEVKPPYDCTIPTGETETAKEDYTITYKVTSDWKDAFNGEISITNNTNKAIEGWSLEFDFDGNINTFWTAKIIKKEGNHYIIENDEWNSVLNSGQTIKLGFEAKHGNTTLEPTNYKLVKSQLGDLDEEEFPEDMEDNNFTEEELKIDTDEDELPDCIEVKITKTIQIIRTQMQMDYQMD